MTIKTYFIVENNIVTNRVVWDGDVNTWQPPEGSIQLVDSETLAKLWELDYEATPMDFVLKEYVGQGDIGFIWNGSFLMTPVEKPPMPKGQIIDDIPGATTAV